MNTYKIFPAALSLVLTAGGCGTASAAEVRSFELPKAETAQYLEQTFDEDDLNESYDNETASRIILSGTSASADGNGASAEGSEITISAGGEYVITGTLSEGAVTVDSEDSETVHLILDGAEITSSSGPAIYIKNAEKVIITIVTGTANTLQASGENADEKKGTVYSKADLVINGGGTLSLKSENGDGIHAGDSVRIINTILNIESASDGIDAEDLAVVKDSILTINAQGDGIKAAGEEDEATGEKEAADISVCGGVITINAGDDAFGASGDVICETAELNLTAGGGYENGEAHTGDMMVPGSMEGQGGPGFGGMGNSSQFMGPGSGMRPDMHGENSDGFPFPETEDGSIPFEDENVDLPELDENTEPGQFQDMFTPENTATPDTANTKADSSAGEETASASKGISADGNIVIYSGIITINASDDAMNAAGSVTIEDGTLSISTGDDGIHADDTLSIHGGDLKILEGYEGLEGTAIEITDGVLDITVSDDGINAANKLTDETFGIEEDDGSYLTISGGTITIDAGADGIDLNGSGTVSGGTVVIYGPENNGNGALDYAGTFIVTGGTLLAGGSSGMAMLPSAGDSVSVLAIGTDGTGTIQIKDESGNVLAEYTSEKSFSHLAAASDAFEKGSTVTVSQGDKELGSAELNDEAAYINTTAGSGMTNPAGGQQPMQGMRPDSGMSGEDAAQQFGHGPRDNTESFRDETVTEEITGEIKDF